MRHRISIYLSITVILSSMLSWGDTRGCPPGVPCLNLEKGEYDAEARAGLFMTSLYLSKAAGGDTGVCVDYVPASPERDAEFKIGFSSDAFVTSSSKIDKSCLDTEKLRSILDRISKSQGGAKTDLEITGYADGQHFFNAESVEKSIIQNTELAAARAMTVAEELRGAGQIFNVKTRGVASPELERSSPTGPGIKCDTRRKVVVAVQAHPGEIKPEDAGGGYVPKNRHFTPEEKNHVIAGYQSAFDDAKAEGIPLKILDRMIRNKALSPACALHPVMRTLLLSKITSDLYWDASEERKNHELAKLQGFLEHPTATKSTGRGANSFSKLIDSKKVKSAQDLKLAERQRNELFLEGLKTSPLLKDRIDLAKIKDRGFGLPSNIYWCFQVKQEVREKFLRSSAVSGNELIRELKGTGLKGNAVFSVGSDPAFIKASELRGPPARPGQPAPPVKTVKGYVCSGCGKGIIFEKGEDGHDHAALDDRLFMTERKGQDKTPLLDALNSISDELSSVGAYTKPRTFIIEGCKDCNCDLQARISARAGVTTIDPLASDQARIMAKVSKNNLSQACVVSPPVLHSCLVDPRSDSQSGKVDSSTFLSFFNPLSGMVEQAENIEQALKRMTLSNGSCLAQSGAVQIRSYQEMINSVACSADSKRKLPSDGPDAEKVDCP